MHWQKIAMSLRWTAWPSEMGDYIRSFDVHGHLITTSTVELHSPVHSAMDYFQPYLYAPPDMFASPQRFEAKHREVTARKFRPEPDTDGQHSL